jgi:hypothetical protein
MATWSVIDGPGVDAYGKSKILAERARGLHGPLRATRAAFVTPRAQKPPTRGRSERPL